jgi:hypothetical protein
LIRAPLITVLMVVIKVAGGQIMTSHLSRTSLSMPASRRASLSAAVVPFIFQFPATSGLGDF